MLLVDDEEDSREMMASVLETCGATVVAAASAQEALRALTRWHVDVMLSDIAMPDKDGYELIREVRSTNAAPDCGRTGSSRDGMRAGTMSARKRSTPGSRCIWPNRSTRQRSRAPSRPWPVVYVREAAGAAGCSAGSSASSRVLKNSANSTSTTAAPAAGTSQMRSQSWPARPARVARRRPGPTPTSR